MGGKSVVSSEPELLEEPPVLSRLVPLLELGPDHEACLLLLDGVLQDLFVQVGLVKGDVHAVPRRHQVVVVHNLKENDKIKWVNLVI